MNDFETNTYQYIKETDIHHRKSLGQYFTPRWLRQELLSKLPRERKHLKVLDPACGTGEFLLSAKDHFPDASLEGWDIDPKLIFVAGNIIPAAKLKTRDALLSPGQKLYDVVIGNPPYYEFSPSKKLRSRYASVIAGRANIFSFFIKLGLDLLKDDGYLGYIVPPSMNNGAYFSNLRRYIRNFSNIEYMRIVETPRAFDNVSQLTMILILKKKPNQGSYTYRRDGIEIFSQNPEALQKIYKRKTSFRHLGFKVKTGRLIWNQNKKLLSHDANNATLLIWSNNITSQGLKIPASRRRPQYVKRYDADEGPAIVVNRVTGAARSARLKAAFIPPGMKFIAENHCNVIFPDKTNATSREFKHLLAELRSTENLKALQNITGNTQISKTELENLFPVGIRHG